MDYKDYIGKKVLIQKSYQSLFWTRWLPPQEVAVCALSGDGEFIQIGLTSPFVGFYFREWIKTKNIRICSILE